MMNLDLYLMWREAVNLLNIANDVFLFKTLDKDLRLHIHI
jgi:hypothetical protein